MLLGIITVFCLWIAGCGSEDRARGFKNEATSCPLYFASENLCAEITWVKGPSADVKSAFVLVFWKRDTNTSKGPLSEPSAQVGVFLRMSCCGSISFPKVEKAGLGKFSVTEANFMPGNWEVYVQLKQGENLDKQFVKVQVDD